ncbi:hypothetical protein [Bacillus alkalisoli]|uniref:hypothetical protein n=1 Tax=Bacillus alkalisoli TaxID=2011008 RepID=UPI000C23F4EF|nr:hypothetical protein [Bacillus alkalisoli]
MGKPNKKIIGIATKTVASTILFGSLLLPLTTTNAENMHKMSYPTVQVNTTSSYANSSTTNIETRLSGSSRFSTTTAISEHGWESGSNTVVIATGRNCLRFQ